MSNLTPSLVGQDRRSAMKYPIIAIVVIAAITLGIYAALSPYLH